MSYALLFPGQGSQSVGMLSALASGYPEIQDTIAEAGEVLGWDLATLVQQGPEVELNRTERTQPALLAAGVAVWRLWRGSTNRSPACLAGHSLGEYSALVAAGSLTFADALKLVELRGCLMQAAVPEGQGGMVAVIGLDDEACEAIGARSPCGVLEAVNFNAPGQVVFAGERAALDWLNGEARVAGARMVVPLPVSVPSHCRLMRDAADKLYEALEEIEIRPPTIPVLHNLDAQARDRPVDIREALRDQLHRPVRWSALLQGMKASGIVQFMECGPGAVLTGLNKRNGRLPCEPLGEPAGFERALRSVCKE